jgi:hypothetical protein
MKLIKWLFTSSADPRQTSLTVKAALLGVLPLILHFVGQDVDANVIVEMIGDVVFWGLTIISSLSFLFGALRKLWLTFKTR